MDAELLAQIDELVRVGNQLARSIGHSMGCPKVSSALPCTCGAGSEQEGALAAWDRLAEKISNGD